MNVNPEDIKSWSQATAAALAALKAAKDLLPTGKKKADAEKAIEAAERDLEIAAASAASELGFELCRRHWPPGIMVMNDDDILVCRECGKADPGVGAQFEVRTHLSGARQSRATAEPFVEHRGAKFKKKEGGGFHHAVYCPVHKISCSPFPPGENFVCSQCNWFSSFKEGELDAILLEVR
jgi:hypothetical protein